MYKAPTQSPFLLVHTIFIIKIENFGPHQQVIIKTTISCASMIYTKVEYYNHKSLPYNVEMAYTFAS